ncbi:iron reductase [Wolfiporia cocos MD-104 SS10]|uniref:ferric-chelate reductase (NADPH) n=1 Tax=Wolfiporia cocos (strain MD-104) TaxID=742152 RepID=A0A2H3JLP2_WOLCO|nr:iron reductase [Wolfiporia cocos MD-104 SS10]
MSNYGTPPTIPAAAQQYNSYVEDPKWQRKFSIIWASILGGFVVLFLPRLVHSLKNGRLFRGLLGISEGNSKNYTSVESTGDSPKRHRRRFTSVFETFWSVFWWSLPLVELSLGQVILAAAYIILVITCITQDVALVTYPNRAGFLALAQFPVVFLFATKNSVLSILLGPGNGYERLNFLHRWAGRGMFLGALIHGSLWINNHLVYDIPIIGQQKETSGVAALGVFCGIVLFSIRPFRRYFYQSFFVIHVLGYVAFFITICYHTEYASPWIFPPLAFYGFDMFLRFFRYRIKDATLIPVDSNMTLINVHDSNEGWQPGQHVRLRVFFSGRIFESHPLTICNAPSSTSCTPSQTLTLAARVKGDWTRALNVYAAVEQDRLRGGEKGAHCGVPIQVMVDGPYGGCSVDLGDYESALLVAGGSGATFTMSLLDDIVGRCVKLGRQGGEKTRRIEFVWCTRSFGSIEWFAPTLVDLASAVAGTSLDLHISIFVTCLCEPEKVPTIPNSDVMLMRPSVGTILQDFMTDPSTVEIADEGSVTQKLNWVGVGGGVAVCAAGPESLITATRNAAAKLSLTRGLELGGIGLHTELFAL